MGKKEVALVIKVSTHPSHHGYLV